MRWLLALVLAGCMTAPSSVPSEPDASPPIPAFGAPVEVGATPPSTPHGGLGRSEAFLAMHGDDVLVCTHGILEGPALAWRSRDGGASFEAITFPPETGLAGDCDAQISEDGTWYVVHSLVQGTMLTVSHDRGATWQARPVTVAPMTGPADRPWLLATDQALYLTFMDLYMGPGAVAFTKSLDQGATWSMPMHIALGNATYPQRMHGRPLLLPDGDVAVPIRAMQDTNLLAGRGSFGGPVETTLYFARSGDGGATWTESHPLGPLQGHSTFPVATADPAGTLWWVEPLQSPAGVELGAFWSNGSWQGPTILATGMREAPQASIDAGAGGATVAWVGSNATHAEHRLHAAVVGGARWDLGPAAPPEFLMVAHNQEGLSALVHIHDGRMWFHQQDAASSS